MTFTSPPRPSRGFSLLEIIVVFVILGIIAAVAIPTYQKSVDKGHDSGVSSSLLAYQQDIAAAGAYRNTEVITVSDVQTAARNMEGKTVTPDTDEVPQEANALDKVVYRISDVGDAIGLAELSPSGRCVLILAKVGGNATTTTAEGTCDGDRALNIAP